MPQRMQSLQLLMQREQQLCDEAQAALQRADAVARRAAEQREQLAAYRSEYEARWSAQFRGGSTVQILLHYRSFMQRLDQALQLQTRQADSAQRRLAQARQDLLDCERRVASVRKLIERRGAELAQLGRRREQKLSDEQAQRMRWRQTQRDPLRPQ